MVPGVVADVQAKGLAERSEGAVVVHAEKPPPALIQKRDGAFTYTTTDLATIQYRVKEWQPNAILYVVDSRQAFHFKALFDIARPRGVGNVELEHVSFGSVLGPDRKPINTRAGNPVATLGGLLAESGAPGRQP